MEPPTICHGIGGKFVGGCKKCRRTRDLEVSFLDNGTERLDRVASMVAAPGVTLPEHVSFIAIATPVSKASASEDIYGNYEPIAAPTHVLVSYTSDLSINRHMPLFPVSMFQLGDGYRRAIDYPPNANFLMLSEAADPKLPLMNRFYPTTVTYDSWRAPSTASQSSDAVNGLNHESAVGGAVRHLGLTTHVGSRFDNVKQVNSFFMADETRLPIYIAAFGTGFFSVLICLCALVYVKYVFTKGRREKDDKRQRGISTLPLLDKRMLVEAQSRENLAEIRATNPALARIEDYISGEVKKWERRMKLAEEKAANPGGYEDIVNDLVSVEESDDDDTNTAEAHATSNNVVFDNLFRGNPRFDGSRVEESESEESDSEEESEEEYTSEEESSSEYTDSEDSSDSESEPQV
ncbi:hypothetical protein X943_002129 [Babesia divergens]|uniref:Uncharacterized protein n=1 Tax=Babesia divergens TaxID=32595 RepID=A0AAD9G782_BABDI|nr:hypothetical protein X943_002129 [Babesia divergens]